MFVFALLLMVRITQQVGEVPMYVLAVSTFGWVLLACVWVALAWSSPGLMDT